ncbi:CCCH zinc finger domain protein [Diplocarpon rosae]|nr:CCCH zinc finger domain protein [Diplocarpon rosae]
MLTSPADNCKFLHPSNSNSNPNHQPLSNGNRFAALQDNGNSRNSNNGYHGRAAPAGTLPYSLDKSAILVDLTSERPQWILSAYGPGRGAPAQLFGGPVREQSFEEMRLLHYMALASGNPQQAVQHAEKLFHDSEQQIQIALNDIDGAINFVISSEKDHPNRIDIVRESQAAGPGSQSNPFSNQSSLHPASSSTLNTFGAANPQPLAGSPFGAPSAPTFGGPTSSGGAFGQPSVLGQKPSTFGGGNSAFGAPTQLGSRGVFGQSAALGQNPNPFGAPSSSSAAPFSNFAGSPSPFGQKKPDTIPFGQPATSTPFGAPPQTATLNPFGVSSQPVSQAPFGAPAQPTTSNPFGTSSQPTQPNPFGRPSDLISSPNPFDGNPTQPNPLGGTTAAAFGVPSPVKNAFGVSIQSQPPQGVSNPFGGTSSSPQPNIFGAPTSAPAAFNPFAQPISNSSANANSLGNSISRANGTASDVPQPLRQHAANQTSGNVQMGAPHPTIETYSTKDASGILKTFKGKQVTYRAAEPATGDRPAKIGDPGYTGPDGKWERIWFPDGAPIFNKDTAVENTLYDEKIEAAYRYAKQTGTFQGGKMPLLPPKREWCSWDF